MAGHKGRFSIFRMMVVVSIVAAECGLLRTLFHPNSRYFAPTLIILPLRDELLCRALTARSACRADLPSL